MKDMIDKLINGPHLLYITGDDVNFKMVESIVKTVPHFPMGPFCWLVRPVNRNVFIKSLEKALPEGPLKSEMFMCPVSRYSMLHTTQGGNGLEGWLKQHGGEA
jgi:hypothetical protein